MHFEQGLRTSGRTQVMATPVDRLMLPLTLRRALMLPLTRRSVAQLLIAALLSVDHQIAPRRVHHAPPPLAYGTYILVPAWS
jgi:hypothetical protein